LSSSRRKWVKVNSFPNLGECQWRCVADTYEAGHAVCAVGPVHYSMIELAGCRRHRKGLLRSA